MLASSIAWILIVSGIATAGGGLAACLFPRLVLQFVFGVKSADGATMFVAGIAGKGGDQWSRHGPYIPRTFPPRAYRF